MPIKTIVLLFWNMIKNVVTTTNNAICIIIRMISIVCLSAKDELGVLLYMMD